MSRTYKFGEVIEWDVEPGTIRWFIVGGAPGHYDAVWVGGEGLGTWEYMDGRVASIGVGLDDPRAADVRVLTDE